MFENVFFWKFPFHLTFIPEFPEFSVEWFAFRKFNNFRIFWNFSPKFSILFVPVSKIRNFWSKCKRPRLHRYRKFSSSLPSQCFNPRQPSRIALNFPAKPVCQVEIPFAGRFIPRVANLSLE